MPRVFGLACLQAQVPGQVARVPSSALHSFEVGFGGQEQHAVLGRLAFAAQQVAERLMQQHTQGFLPVAVLQAANKLALSCLTSCGGPLSSGEDVGAAVLQHWLLQEALADARAVHFDLCSRGTELLQQFAAYAGPRGTERVQTPMQQLQAQLHRPWFLAACCISEGSGSLANDPMMQTALDWSKAYGSQLAVRLQIGRWEPHAVPKELCDLMLAAFQVSGSASLYILF